jgi:hypothetical protein
MDRKKRLKVKNKRRKERQPDLQPLIPGLRRSTKGEEASDDLAQSASLEE